LPSWSLNPELLVVPPLPSGGGSAGGSVSELIDADIGLSPGCKSQKQSAGQERILSSRARLRLLGRQDQPGPFKVRVSAVTFRTASGLDGQPEVRLRTQSSSWSILALPWAD
jgi:hypothetical protein